ncbi:Hypothetical predicted protein [Lecanosticta acicola]|uniref:Uncharacterized protein n=1 Tax=Lecanosticta acicola TaxID=111012 RepID=A0AAI9ED89_9PEZI|nr:Hypothetical predicted protein [Lecanosticta acicola]
MCEYNQSRSSDSSATSGSSGSSYQLILDHILNYPGSYEIPLRTMYALNCHPPSSPTSSTASSPAISQGGFPDGQTTESLTQNLMTQLSNLPGKDHKKPPSFITSFVQRCFPAQLTQVDFPQALTGLDYLKDLETRRRSEVASAMDRLDIDREALTREDAGLAEKYPGVAQWVKSIEEKERKIDTLYTQVYIGLRRWVIINELSLMPFHKHNCVAMLNTLYPPMGMQTQPTSKLTPAVLKSQRNGFFKYIQAVERNGPSVLTNLVQQGKAPSDVNGWVAVTRTLSIYLQLANSIINECIAISDAQDVSPHKKRDSNQSRHTRKADSGISFTSEHRPSTRGSVGEPVSPMEPSRPKTPGSSRQGSATALEKLARGLKTIGRSRTDVTEMISGESHSSFQQAERPKMLRKMRSLGSLGERKGSVSTTTSRQESDTPAFDVEEMRRQRLQYEARKKDDKRASNEV